MYLLTLRKIFFVGFSYAYLKKIDYLLNRIIFSQYPCSHLFIGSLWDICHMLTSQVSLIPHHLTLWLSNRNYNLVFSIWNAICPTLWRPECETLNAEATVPPLGIKLNSGSSRNSSLLAGHSLFITKYQLFIFWCIYLLFFFMKMTLFS